jgi:serine/threonine-protein kinase RIM15
VEVQFYLWIEPFNEWDDPNSMFYQLMKGKVMTMTDREEGMLSHTMWVIKLWIS